MPIKLTSSPKKKAVALVAAFFAFQNFRLFCCLLFAVSACSPKSANVSLRKSGNITFRKPSGFYPKSPGQSNYWYDSLRGCEYYYFLDKQANVLYCASTSGRLQHDSLPLHLLSLQHLFHYTNRPIETMGVLNADSLIFIDGNLQDICLTDKKGNYILEWRPRAPIYGRIGYFIDTYTQPIYCRRNLVYLQCAPDLGMIIADTSIFHRYLTFNAGLVLNLHDTTFASNKTGAYPGFLSAKNNFNVCGPITCVSPLGHYIFSFGPLSEIYDYALDGTFRVMDAPSRFHRAAKSPPFSALANDRQALIDTKLYEPEYTRLVSDPYRGRYLRVYMHGLPRPAPGALLRPAYADVPWSLLILDNDFRRIGEVNFSANFDPNSLLVTRQGILVGNNRPERPGYEPAVLRYQLFTYATSSSVAANGR